MSGGWGLRLRSFSSTESTTIFSDSIAATTSVASSLVEMRSFSSSSARHRRDERLPVSHMGIDLPVLLRKETSDLRLPVAEKSKRHRLNAPGRQACEAAPRQRPRQERTHHVAHQAIQNAARSLRFDPVDVDPLRRFESLEDDRLGDLIEDRPREGALVLDDAIEDREEVIGDRLPLAIMVGGQVDVGRILGGFTQFGDQFGSLRLELGREFVLDIDPKIVLGQIAKRAPGN